MVVSVSNVAENCDTVTAAIEAEGHEGMAYVADCTQRADVDGLVAAATASASAGVSSSAYACSALWLVAFSQNRSAATFTRAHFFDTASHRARRWSGSANSAN